MINSVAKAMKILEYLASSNRDGFRPIEISRHFKMKPSTTLNFIDTLVKLGYVQKTGGEYGLTGKILTTFMPYFKKEALFDIAEPSMVSLAGETRENVVLAIYRNGLREQIGHISAERTVMVNPRAISNKNSLYDSATGRILLAWLDDREFNVYIEKNGLPGDAWPEIRTKKRLKAACASLRREGFSVYEADSGSLSAFGAPVFGPEEKVIASLGVYMPRARCNSKRKKTIIDRLVKAGRNLSEKIAGGSS